jgi:threonyl-tRNA synthetase
MKIKLNGKTTDVKDGAKIADLAGDRKFLVAQVDGVLKDLSAPVKGGSEIELIDFSRDEGKRIFWHSSSHIMAMAVKMLFPETKLAIGPAIGEGFYYDFEPVKPFSPDDLKKIEEKMREIVKQDLPFERLTMKKEAVAEFFRRRNENYKVELAKDIPDEELSLYRNGDFVDLCLGPHLPSAGFLGAFKLLSLAGAYWRGDSKQAMLSRIYGISFPTESELKDYLKRIEEAQKRDHRKLGQDLELFSFFEEAGAGLVFWHPKGTIILRKIEEYWYREHLAAGYEITSTPHIARSQLWHQSGHYDFYHDKMYTLPVENEEYVLKPMNCPGHILIYKSKVRSYRELPIKLAELGMVYRNELSGTLHGLLRVRGFTIDDAHIFCTPDQINDELVKVIELSQKMLKKFGFEKYRVELSVWDPKAKGQYMGSEAEWERAEAELVAALKKVGLEYKRMVGEAAFYGPKVDIKIIDALGRDWQATTIQFDFNLPKRFKIEYMDRDGHHKEVVVIHRALYGSLERFMGCLIEHYAGAFPLWLTPVQVVVMPITDKEHKYAKDLMDKCIKQDLRAELNDKSEKINYRIREAELQKVPYILVVGAKEIQDKTVSVRKRGRGNMGAMKLKDFFSLIEPELGGED